MKNATFPMLLALLVTGCTLTQTSPTPATIPTSLPSLPPSLAPSDTPEPEATFTPLPAWTPTPLTTPTLGFLFYLPSYTPTAGLTPEGPFACDLLFQSVENESHFGPRQKFDVGWKLLNTGSSPWLVGNVDFAFFGGTKMFVYTPVQLETSVQPGNATSVVGEMVAPRMDGKYKAIWSLRRGNDYFCRVSVTITVP